MTAGLICGRAYYCGFDSEVITVPADAATHTSHTHEASGDAVICPQSHLPNDTKTLLMGEPDSNADPRCTKVWSMEGLECCPSTLSMGVNLQGNKRAGGGGSQLSFGFNSRAAVTKYEGLGGLNNRNVVAHSRGGWKFQVKVLQG